MKIYYQYDEDGNIGVRVSGSKTPPIHPRQFESSEDIKAGMAHYDEVKKEITHFKMQDSGLKDENDFPIFETVEDVARGKTKIN